MNTSAWTYILVMGGVTYLIRVLPLLLLRLEIRSPFVRSFLHYVPYVALATMVFPAIFAATASIWSALAGFVVAVVFALRGRSMFTVALLACAAVFVTELLIA